MNVRSINKKQNTNATSWTVNSTEFPKDKDGVIYVRQSSPTQQQKNIHSFEMQTDKFLEHFRNMGCTGHIEIIADDEGLSGTLDIHKRKGLARVVKLIEEGKIGWLGGVYVNRFTRDPWLITPAVLMKKCYEHHVWIATLRMNFNFEDEYCQRVFMLEAEESARHLKWMKVILGGAKSVASDNGYYDGRFIVPGYIVDRSDEQKSAISSTSRTPALCAGCSSAFWNWTAIYRSCAASLSRCRMCFPALRSGSIQRPSAGSVCTAKRWTTGRRRDIINCCGMDSSAS